MPDDADPHDSTPPSSATLACDLLVVGSGAGGLAAAVTAAHLGLSVIVVEKESRLGGTTAWSGGWMWIPRNPLARAAGIEEDAGRPLAYLRRELGAQFDEARALAFLDNGPRMVDFFQRHTALQFIDGNAIPDFHGRTPDASTGGRSVCAAPFDARRLGKRAHQIKPPLPETTLWGMGIGSGRELRHFLDASTSPRSAWYVAKRLAAYARDRLLHGRGLRLVNGNALTGALAASAFEAGVQVLVDHAARRLLRRGERVVGAVVESPAGRVRIEASRGVVLACGGFPHDPERLKALLPHAPTGREHWSAGSHGNTGDGLRLGESVGGLVADDLAQSAALAPVSLVPRADGSVAHFPHLIERAKPGLIAVRCDGRRFVNEADSYHDFMRGLLAATPAGEPVEAWLICDSAFIRRFGLGAVKPAPIPHRPMLANGYLKRGRTLAELAVACGIDPAGLAATVDRYNAQALQGRDEDFAKGETPYNRVQGEVRAGLANPCMAPIERGPFYAVKVVAGSLGTFAGLRVDAKARVLDRQGAPIAGLYAAGNDMASVMGGHYPSGGITLGPAMTFAWIAAHDAAGVASPSADRRPSAPAPSQTVSTEPLIEEPIACTTR
ncbi:FAD-dependent oxidoreductase [Variovorax sp. Sphag1AA]|uniref:FAD-dependent oxidoreductase n=1 Tax=Variovorax sp. Sphag1AA TaxID=2587027 RepID=UPI001620ADD0|nr:FAD-dependent oxidoreductase [Variovorax sp. Sphag1AA]MBB3178655.1 succinate dehydrogenase/fumarate reductase flavoprotein subunit [Variovorax sp. Sphag1AA]